MPPTAWLYYVAAALVLVASIHQTGGDSSLQLFGVVYAAALVVSFAYPPVALTATVTILLIEVSLLAGTRLIGAVDTRYLAVPFMAALLLRAVTVGPPAVEPRGLWSAQLTAMLRLSLPSVAVYALVSLYWSINPAETTDAVIGLVVAAVLGLSVGWAMSMDQVARAIAVVGWAAIALSLVLLLVAPGLALVAGRLRGIFLNANGLAAFTVVVAPILLARLGRLRWPAALLLIVVCVATASRAGFAALVLEILIFTLAGRRSFVRMTVTVTALVSGLIVALVVATSDIVGEHPLKLLRTNDSRIYLWARGLAYFRDHQFLGVGVGALPPTSSGGLVPELLATFGLLGTTLAAFFLGAVLVAAYRGCALFAALAVGGLVNTLFEPWLFAAGSVYCVVFWLVIGHPGSGAGVGRADEALAGRGRPGAPALPGRPRDRAVPGRHRRPGSVGGRLCAEAGQISDHQRRRV
jgi:hypothetical protein